MATNFGETIKKLRKQHNITQAQLAQALSVGRPTIAGYETKGKQPDYDKLIKLALFFNVSIDYLLNNNVDEYPFLENPQSGSAFESKIPYKDNAEYVEKLQDLNEVLTSIIQKSEGPQISLTYKGEPLNKTTVITIKNTIKNLIDIIEEMNRL